MGSVEPELRFGMKIRPSVIGAVLVVSPTMFRPTCVAPVVLPSVFTLGIAFVLTFGIGCGGGGGSVGTVGPTTPAGTPRPGGAVDLRTVISSTALVVLHADLSVVRRDAAAYERIAGQLATELGLSADAATLRHLLDRTDRTVGFVTPGSAGQEGMLIFSGRYAAEDFDLALALAVARHGSAPAPQTGADGRQIYAMGDATIARLDQWTWAVAVGEGPRAHLAQVALGGGPRFGHDVIEFGRRVGLPAGSAQAWANQDEQVGIDMVALVFAGASPQMVHNFVSTVKRHLGL